MTANLLAELLAPAAADMAAVNALIEQRLHSTVPTIDQLSGYIIHSGGKRLRPVMAVLAARACGYAGDQHCLLAAIVEFIHTATLLHDDVVDESDLRRGRATANSRFGNGLSVLVGDFLYSRSFQMMVELGSQGGHGRAGHGHQPDFRRRGVAVPQPPQRRRHARAVPGHRPQQDGDAVRGGGPLRGPAGGAATGRARMRWAITACISVWPTSWSMTCSTTAATRRVSARTWATTWPRAARRCRWPMPCRQPIRSRRACCARRWARTASRTSRRCWP